MTSFTQFMKTSALGALVASGALLAPTSVLAEQVFLKSEDGTIALTGEYIGFEDNMYVVNTTLGELHVSAEKVTCTGASCPILAIAVTAQDAGTSIVVPDAQKIKFAGSDTVGEGLMPHLIQGWAASADAQITRYETDISGEIVTDIIADQGLGDPLSEISVVSTSSIDAFRSLQTGRVDFGMASRTPNPNEVRSLRNAGAGKIRDASQEHIIAVDSLVAIVHPDNPVQILTIDQLSDIFSGQITNWTQVGGTDAPITVYDRANGSGTRSAFMESLFDSTPQPLSTAEIATTNRDMSDSVANDINAIGYVGHAFQRAARSVALENECGMVIEPDSFSARTEEYSIQRRLYLYNSQSALSPTSQDFLDYVMSSDADEMIEKAGFVSLGVVTRAQDFQSPRAQALLSPAIDQYQGNKMREMLGAMITFDRLSSTFRFNTGSSQLDRRAPIDMARLADYLAIMPVGTQVKFVGFTDNVGEYENNQRLSDRRAAQVMQAMIEFSKDRLTGIQFSSAGFGEISPTACNINDDGREINRRVEVWISAPEVN